LLNIVIQQNCLSGPVLGRVALGHDPHPPQGRKRHQTRDGSLCGLRCTSISRTRARPPGGRGRPVRPNNPARTGSRIGYRWSQSGASPLSTRTSIR
jgi:hypothetical protein